MSDAASQLASYRQTIDNLDAALVHILAERFRCTDQVGLLKAMHDLPAVDPGREDRQFSRLRALARDSQVDQDFIVHLMKSIIKQVVQRHRQIAAEHSSAPFKN
ncbi:chorismate mutase [Bordetella muralis]|jgi:chorismate mutase|uniref:chorismate mutase n=1 Tax=Bordetella muralis TaxID=1649130 RepID=UPI0039EE16C1